MLQRAMRQTRRGFVQMRWKSSTSTVITEKELAKKQHLLISTRDTVQGRMIVEELGLVCASVVQTKSILEDILAALGGMVGGETRSYSALLNETTSEAVHRMKAAAIVSVLRFF